MIGFGILLRLIKGFLGKPLENTGALPTRYYLHETLRSLDRDNIGEAVRFLRISRGALIDKSRWELVRQQVLFRSRVLMESHERRIRHIEGRMKALRNQRKLPWRWFGKSPIDRLPQYENILAAEKSAQALLERYEKELRDMREAAPSDLLKGFPDIAL